MKINLINSLRYSRFVQEYSYHTIGWRKKPLVCLRVLIERFISLKNQEP